MSGRVESLECSLKVHVHVVPIADVSTLIFDAFAFASHSFSLVSRFVAAFFVPDDAREQCANTGGCTTVALAIHDVLAHLDFRSLRQLFQRPEPSSKTAAVVKTRTSSKLPKYEKCNSSFSSTDWSVKRARTDFLFVCSLITTFFIQQFGAQL
jgi:hypothetical protein